MNQRFINCYLNDGYAPTYKEVASALNISYKEVQTLYNNKEHRAKLQSIQTVRKLHNSIKNRSDTKYDFQGFKDFYTWYEKIDKICCYCGITEQILEKIWQNNWRTKRRRGRKLEVERVNSSSNLYNSKNCKLACYFCNNHKSDLITKEHYDKHFATPMKNYLEEISKIVNPNPHLNELER